MARTRISQHPWPPPAQRTREDLVPALRASRHSAALARVRKIVNGTPALTAAQLGELAAILSDAAATRP